MLGDIHADFDVLENIIDDLPRNSLLFQVGDFGLGFSKYKEKHLLDINEKLKNSNITIFSLRGNHDDPKYWVNNDCVSFARYSNIGLVEDYAKFMINDKVFFCIGGAISIDRKLRIPNRDYWSGEGVDYNFDFSKIELGDVEYCVSHTAPMKCFPHEKSNPLLKNYFKHDDELEHDLIEEREFLNKVFDKMVNLQYHYYGHFHDSKNEVINDVNHILLNIDEVKEIKV